MRSLLQDLQFSFRLMRKRPGATFMVLTALALGIGANAAVFSAVNASLIRPLPMRDPEHVVELWAKTKERLVYFSYPEFLDLKAQARSFQDMAAWRLFSFNLTGDRVPEHLTGFGISASYFKTLGVTPALGRDFTEADDRHGAARVAIISYGLWQRRFGGDKSVLGKIVVLDDEPHTIIGVLPSRVMQIFWEPEIWVNNTPFLDADPSMASREMRWFGIIGRLAPSVTQTQAQAELDLLAEQFARQYPKSNKDVGTTLSNLQKTFGTRDRPMLSLMLIASGFVLILACVNVATVSVAGAMERRKELCLRLALGASRSILLRQLFVQGCIFAALGAFFGLIVAKVALTLLIGRFPWALARFQETTVDSTVVWFTISLALVTALVSSLLPGLYAARLNINSELKGEVVWTPWTRFRSAGKGALIVFEVWLAASLVLVSGLLIKSFYELTRVDLGFDPRHLISFSVALPDAHYDQNARSAFYSRALEKLSSIPGVLSASGSGVVPMTPSGHSINLQVDAQSPHATERPFVDNPQILPGFFSSIKTKVLQGREFTEADRTTSPPVAIVDEKTAEQMWPGQSALGKRLRVADVTDDGPPWREIVGVVQQVRYNGPGLSVNVLQIYTPAYQVPPRTMFFVLKTQETVADLKAPAERVIHELDPELALDNFKPLDYYLDFFEGRRKLAFVLLSSFAAVGISLGMIGIYGVVANSVVRRRRELAIRMALGASVGNCITLVTRMGLLAILAGIAIASVMIAFMTRLLAVFLFGVNALDHQIYLLSALIIIILGVVASLVPAAALLRLSPQDVLRE